MKKTNNFNTRVQQYLNDALELSMLIRDIEIITTDYLFVAIAQDKDSLLSKFLELYDYAIEYFIEDLETSHDFSFKELFDCYKPKFKFTKSKYSDEVQKVFQKASELAKKRVALHSQGSIYQIEPPIDEVALTIALIHSHYISTYFCNYDYEVYEELKLIFKEEKYFNNAISDIIENKPQNFMVEVEYTPFDSGQETNTTTDKDQKKEEDGVTTTYNKKIKIPEYLTSLNEAINPDSPTLIRGRDDEIEQVILSLQQAFTPNVLLVGDAGVGKTAIVEGLAERIVKESCPDSLKGYTIFSLDLTSFSKDTKFRGEQEKKFDELKIFLENFPNAILFIDEIHNIIGMGSTTESSFDFSNALKPILTNGKVRIIGATTKEEYRKYFKDSAFKRRFSLIEVDEPKSSKLYSMLKGKIEYLENIHGVSVSKKIFEKVVSEASGYHFEDRNPSRTIKILDLAMVIAKNDGKSKLDDLSVLKVHKKNIKKFLRMDKNSLESTAYHEAGHFLLYKNLNTNFYTVTLVSIIPADDYLGVMCMEENDYFLKETKQDYINKIAELLAGGIASKLKNFDADSGVSNDIEVATNIARNMVLKFNMCSDSTLGKYTNFTTNGEMDLKLLSDSQKEELAKETDKILKEAYDIAENILSKCNNQLDRISRALIQKGSLTKKELDSLFDGKAEIDNLTIPDWNLIK